MSTVSKLGTVTWIEPEFYINYDSITGVIISIGLPLEAYPNFKITVDQAVAFTSGKLNSTDYRIVKEDTEFQIVKSIENQAVSKIYPIKVQQDVFPKIKISRSIKLRQWSISKLVEESIFVFVCGKESSRHYIRTLALTEKEMTIPMIYDSEAADIDLYTKEQYSVVDFKDE